MSIPNTPKEPTNIYQTGITSRSQSTVSLLKRVGREWTVLTLKETERKALEGIVTPHLSQIAKDTEVEISQAGIYQKINGKLEPVTAPTPEVQKTIDYVAKYLVAGGLKPSEIKIGVTVGGTSYKAVRFEEHAKFHNQLAATLTRVSEVNNELQQTDFQAISTQLKTVVKESQNLLDQMNRINEDLSRGDLNQALNNHHQLAQTFVSFSKAAGEYEATRTRVSENAQSNPGGQATLANLTLDLGHVTRMQEATEGFLTFVDPEGTKTAEARAQLQEAAAQLPSVSTGPVSGKNTQLESLEDTFSQQIQEEMAALEDSRTSKQQEKRLTEKQYAAHKQALEELQACSNQVRRMLRESRSADLRKELQAYLPTYQEALTNALKYSPGLDSGHVSQLRSMA